jgi:hypothetical protein
MSKFVKGAPAVLSHGSISLGITAVQVVPANPNRVKLWLFCGSQIFIGGSAVTSADGFPLNPISNSDRVAEIETADAVYAVLSDGTNTLKFIEFGD